MTNNSDSYIIWNEDGIECQRFYNQELGRIDAPHVPNFIQSNYHMSKYSFTSDLIFMLLTENYFFVLPEVKDLCFMGFAPLAHSYASVSAHIMDRNATNIWLLGGTRMLVSTSHKFGYI